jgi:Zn finger protein HypA/HybF involved in hydrogenase expression
MSEKEFETKKFYAYQCWRSKPNECRYGWESPVELTLNTVQCPKCKSYQITCKAIEKRVLKQTPKPSAPTGVPKVSENK